MNQSKLIEALSQVMSDTYALYLKTQNYHWHVKGPHFKMLHELFEEQYKSLADAIDEIAERIVTLGSKAPATFSEFQKLKTIGDGDNHEPSPKLLDDLVHDHEALIKSLNTTMRIAQESENEGSVNLISERIASHEKMNWMLKSSK